MSYDTGTPEFKDVKKQLQEAVEQYFRVCNKENGTKYMPTHWVLMVEGLLMDEDGYSVVFREPSEPAPSHSKQLGLLRYGMLRLEKDILSDDEED